MLKYVNVLLLLGIKLCDCLYVFEDIEQYNSLKTL